MSYQGKSARQKTLQKQSHPGMSEEGLIELDDNQLESISGGSKKGSAAEAQLRQNEGILAALQLEDSRSINVKNTNIVNNNPLSNSGTVGQGSIGTTIKK